MVLSRLRQEHVDAVLDRFFSLARSRAVRLGSRYLTLWQTLEANTRGGKRFRPLMVISAYEAHGGQDPEAAAHLGAAFELLHTALIVHDDVIDRDFVRRGGPNVSGSYRDEATTAGLSIADRRAPRRASAAVIAGRPRPHRRATASSRASGASDGVRARLLTSSTRPSSSPPRASWPTCDSPMPRHALGRRDARMERLKTAVYSFRRRCRPERSSPGPSDAAVDALGEFGRGSASPTRSSTTCSASSAREGQTGKTTLGDLREGKRTVLIAHAAATDRLAARSRRVVGEPDLDDAGRAARRCASVLERLRRPRARRAARRRRATRAGDAARSPAADLPHRPRERAARRPLAPARRGARRDDARHPTTGLGAVRPRRARGVRAGDPPLLHVLRAGDAACSRRVRAARRGRLRARARRRRDRRRRRRARRASTPTRGAACSTPSRPRPSARSRRGYSANLVVHAFARTARGAGIRRRSSTAPFFASMRARPATAPSTTPRASTSYVYGSAEVVGLMCLRAFLVDGDAAPTTPPATRARRAAPGASAPRSRR